MTTYICREVVTFVVGNHGNVVTFVVGCDICRGKVVTFAIGCDICRGKVVTFVVGCDICRGKVVTFVEGCDICRGNVVTFVVGCDICRGLLWHLSGAVTFSGIVTFVGTTVVDPSHLSAKILLVCHFVVQKSKIGDWFKTLLWAPLLLARAIDQIYQPLWCVFEVFSSHSFHAKYIL